jgi:hypothetical protein
MTFNNSKTIISLRIKLFAVTVLFLGYIGIVYAGKLIKFPLLGLGETAATLVVVIIWLITCLLPMLLNYQYFYFSDEGKNLTFRYFNAGIIGGKKNSIEIDKADFSGYTIRLKYFGLSRSLLLYQKVGQSTGKYPPVYISALTRDQRVKLTRSLDALVPAS